MANALFDPLEALAAACERVRIQRLYLDRATDGCVGVVKPSVPARSGSIGSRLRWHAIPLIDARSRHARRSIPQCR